LTRSSARNPSPEPPVFPKSRGDAFVIRQEFNLVRITCQWCHITHLYVPEDIIKLCGDITVFEVASKFRCFQCKRKDHLTADLHSTLPQDQIGLKVRRLIEIRQFTRAMIDSIGNLEPTLDVYPDRMEPIVRNTTAGRELPMVRWGLPSSQHAMMQAAKKRADKLQAKAYRLTSRIW
jgi:hypothetical protein